MLFGKQGQASEQVAVIDETISVSYVLAHEPTLALGSVLLGLPGVLLGALAFAFLAVARGGDADQGDGGADTENEDESEDEGESRCQCGFATGPAPEPAGGTDGAGEDWLVVEEPA